MDDGVDPVEQAVREVEERGTRHDAAEIELSAPDDPAAADGYRETIAALLRDISGARADGRSYVRAMDAARAADTETAEHLAPGQGEMGRSLLAASEALLELDAMYDWYREREQGAASGTDISGRMNADTEAARYRAAIDAIEDAIATAASDYRMAVAHARYCDDELETPPLERAAAQEPELVEAAYRRATEAT